MPAINQQTNEATSQPNASESVVAERQRCDVLVVEDDSGIRTMIRAALKDEGYSVQVAGNGQAALDLLEHYQPHLILLDMMMPIMDGTAFHQALQADARFRAIPIIPMSAAHNLQSLSGAPSIVDVLPKPFLLATLVQAVERHTGRS